MLGFIYQDWSAKAKNAAIIAVFCSVLQRVAACCSVIPVSSIKIGSPKQRML